MPGPPVVILAATTRRISGEQGEGVLVGGLAISQRHYPVDGGAGAEAHGLVAAHLGCHSEVELVP